LYHLGHGEEHRALVELNSAFPKFPSFRGTPLGDASVGLNIPTDDFPALSGTERVLRCDRGEPIDFFVRRGAHHLVPLSACLAAARITR